MNWLYSKVINGCTLNGSSVILKSILLVWFSFDWMLKKKKIQLQYEKLYGSYVKLLIISNLYNIMSTKTFTKKKLLQKQTLF